MDAKQEQFFGAFFPRDDREAASKLGKDEEEEARTRYVEYVKSRIGGMKYILGLGLDFLLLAQKISEFDGNRKRATRALTESDLFNAYELVTSRGSRTANTLTLKVADKSFGIRKLEETVRAYFYSIGRLGYPSAYVYNTGQWRKYADLLLLAFQLSSPSRYLVTKALLALGASHISAAEISAVPAVRLGAFEHVITNYPRSANGENGGLTFQAICFGYVSQAYGHLFISADKTRTGSARQQRVGDIDAFLGESIVLSTEVKDLSISEENFDKELSEFTGKVREIGVQGGVFCRSSTDRARARLSADGVWLFDQTALITAVSRWDSVRQESAISAMLHFLGNIEHNAKAVLRLRAFLSETYNQDS